MVTYIKNNMAWRGETARRFLLLSVKLSHKIILFVILDGVEL